MEEWLGFGRVLCIPLPRLLHEGNEERSVIGKLDNGQLQDGGRRDRDRSVQLGWRWELRNGMYEAVEGRFNETGSMK